MIWKIIIVFLVLNAVFVYLVILGADKCKSDREREEEKNIQMIELSKLEKQKGKKNEKTNNSGETECWKRISENLDRMYKE